MEKTVMNHKQSVLIQFESAVDNERVSQQLKGEWYIKGKAFYITYEEPSEAGVVRNLLRYEPTELKVIRRGALHSEQLYRTHERLVGYYDNSLVKLELEAYTHQIIIKDQYDGFVLGIPSKLPFSLQWEYDLYTGEQEIGRFKLRILLKEDIHL
jgi:uncharacterized beta-barrel protein YwiB (DUF1934 family)